MTEPGTSARIGPDHEQRIVGVCLSNPEQAGGPLDTVPAQWFSAPIYRRTWAAMFTVRRQGGAPNLCAVVEELSRSGDLEPFGADGPAALLPLVMVSPDAADFAELAPAICRLREEHARREAGIAARRIPTAAEEYAAEWTRPAPVLIPTGLAPLDETLGGGLLPASLTVLAAATGRGKSGLAMQLGRNWMQQGRRVLYVHTEMTPRQVLARFLGSQIERPWLDLVLEAPADAGASIEAARHYLPRLTRRRWKEEITDLTRTVEQVREQYPGEPLVLIVDHLTDLARGIGSADMRHATQRFTSELKAIAERFAMLVFVVAQTARGVEQPRSGGARRTGRDFESAAKDAGEVEADASTVLYLQSEPCQEGGSATASLHVAKSRGSAAGMEIPLCFRGPMGTFIPRPEALTAEDLRLLATLAAQATGDGFIGVAPIRTAMKLGQDKCLRLINRLAARGLVDRGEKGTRLTSAGHEALATAPSPKGRVGPS